MDTPLAALELDRSLEVDGCSPAFCEMFECTPAEVLGRDVDALVEGSGLSMRLRTGETPDEVVSLTIAGTKRLARITVRRDDLRFHLRFERIVERDFLYRLIATEQRWKSLFHNTDDGLGVVDREGRIVEHNAAFVRFLKLPLRPNIAPQENMHVGRRLRKALGLEVPGLAAYLDAPDGEFVGRIETGPLTVEVKGRPITLVDGSRAGTFFLVRDIGEELQLRERDALIRSDLEIARKFQSMILSVPPEIDPYKLEIAYRPLDQVGGDLYDVASLPASSVRFFIADATGHGVPAALVTMLIRSAYESVKYTLGGPAAVLEALNDRIATTYRRGDVVFTALVLDLSLETGFVELANGGHPPPILVDSTGVHELEAGGTVLGARGYRTFPAWSRRIEPGASLYLFTDGICEARRGDDYFGQERLEAAIKAADATDSATGSVLAELDRFLADSRQSDDITLMAIRKR